MNPGINDSVMKLIESKSHHTQSSTQRSVPQSRKMAGGIRLPHTLQLKQDSGYLSYRYDTESTTTLELYAQTELQKMNNTSLGTWKVVPGSSSGNPVIPTLPIQKKD
jgi:hypothetical protein